MRDDYGSLSRQLHLAMEKSFNKDLEEFGLTGIQARILFYICHVERKGEINQRDIEHRMHLSNPTVSGILQRLEDKGLIVREVSKTDARSKCIEPSEITRTFAEKLHQKGQILEERLLKGITPEEQDMYKKVVHQMLKNMRDIDVDDHN